jgi:hypothetical protein
MIDRYTKAILTVIAAALVAIVIQSAVRPSKAMDDIQMVKICDTPISCVGTVPTGNIMSRARAQWALAVSPSK